MKIALIGHGRLGNLISKYLGRDFELIILDKEKKLEDLEKIKDCKIVILSVPISNFPDTLQEIKNYLSPNTIVADTCSVKEWPIQQMEKLLPENVFLLGTHPMFGPDSVKDTLFGTKLVICPHRIHENQLEEVINYLHNHGIRTIHTTAEDHDQQMSSSLLLSHFIGKGLLQFGAKEQVIDTKGYRRLLRILETVRNDSDILFRDMFKYNRFAKSTLNNFSEALNHVQSIIND